MEQDLYDRQERLPGWEQERLSDATVAIIGSDWLAGCCALYLACLGVGRIYLLDDTRAVPGERFFFPLTPDHPRVQGWADWLQGLGFQNRIIARRINPALSPALMPPADVVLSATSDPVVQEAIAHTASTQSLSLVLGAVQESVGAYRVHTPDAAKSAFSPLIGETISQGALPGLTLGALMAEEVRRFLLPLPEDCILPAGMTLHFNPTHPTRFYCITETESQPQLPPTQHQEMPGNILLVGAGALGTFAGLGLAVQPGIKNMTIVDPDYVEPSNGNRQFFFLNKNGEGKSFTLANSLKQINNAIRIDSYADGIRAEHFDICQPDIVLCCTDSFVSRHLVHQECIRRGIALISGGTSAFSGNLAAYVPGKTACLDCLFGLTDLAAREEHEHADPARCQNTPEPSIVTTNALIGSLMALMASQVASPMHRVIYYDAHLAKRFRWGYARKPCKCVHPFDVWLSERSLKGEDNV